MKRRLSRRLRRRLAVQERVLERDHDGLRALWDDDPNLLSGLVGLLNELDDLLRWRTIEAFGLLVAELAERDIDAALIQVRRLTWSMTEESGNQAWHGAEAIGEVLYHSSELAEEFVVPLMQYEEEPIFRPGALWAMGRLAGRYPKLLTPEAGIAVGHIHDENPLCRGHAAWALGCLKHHPARDPLAALVDDPATVKLYDFAVGEMVETTVGQLAREAINRLSV